MSKRNILGSTLLKVYVSFIRKPFNNKTNYIFSKKIYNV